MTQRTKTDHKKAATAYHEAGHAFADFIFGFKIKNVSIISDSQSTGRVVTRPGLRFRSLEYTTPTVRQLARLHEQVISLLAGEVAQRHFKPRSMRSHHTQSDLEAVGDLLFRLHAENELPHVFLYLKAKAKNLVEHPKHWMAIEHLAAELLKHHTMSGQEVKVAIREGFQTYRLL